MNKKNYNAWGAVGLGAALGLVIGIMMLAGCAPQGVTTIPETSFPEATSIYKYTFITSTPIDPRQFVFYPECRVETHPLGDWYLYFDGNMTDEGADQHPFTGNHEYSYGFDWYEVVFVNGDFETCWLQVYEKEN